MEGNVENSTVKDFLDRGNQLQQSLTNNTKYCESFLHENTTDKEVQTEILNLISSILNEIDMYKSEQYQMMLFNHNNEARFRGTLYKISELLKLKEARKLKIDILKKFSGILDKHPNTKLQLEIQIQISKIQPELDELNKILNYFNNRTIYEPQTV